MSDGSHQDYLKAPFPYLGDFRSLKLEVVRGQILLEIGAICYVLSPADQLG